MEKSPFEHTNNKGVSSQENAGLRPKNSELDLTPQDMLDEENRLNPKKWKEMDDFTDEENPYEEFEGRDLSIGNRKKSSQKEDGYSLEREPVDAEYEKKAEELELKRLRESIHKNYAPTDEKIEFDMETPEEGLHATTNDDHNIRDINLDKQPLRETISSSTAKNFFPRWRNRFGRDSHKNYKTEKIKEARLAAKNIVEPEPGFFGRLKKFFSEDEREDSEAA